MAQGPVINEVHRAVPDDTLDHDGIELYAPGPTERQLQGLSLVQGDRRVLLDLLPTDLNGAFIAFRSGAHPGELALPIHAHGGTILLLDADGATILDVFTYPPIPAGSSFGRLPDGSKDWSYFERPSLGGPAPPQDPIRSIAPLPELSLENGRLVVHAPDARIQVTFDGRPPEMGDMQEADPSFILPSHAAVRARSVKNGALPGPEAVIVPDAWGDRPSIGLTLDPADLNDPDRGINVEGRHANFSRRGHAWERPADLTIVTDSSESTSAVTIRISGNGTRGLAKRSFHLALERTSNSELHMPDGSSWRRLILRSDATPHAFIGNLVAEVLVHRAGDRVDVQPSNPLPLYLNGHYWGLYRAMPTKGEDFICRSSGAEDHDIIEGPAGRVVEGDRSHYESALKALQDERPLAEIEELIDLGSLVDLACFDLYCGRADHDLNMRCWRPRSGGGRWRWILYDMDLWAPPDDHDVDRICDAAFPSAPFLAQLLGQRGLRDRLLARLSVLLGTVLAPASVSQLVDSLADRWGPALERDRERWCDELDLPDPAVTVARMHAIAGQRPMNLIGDLKERTGLNTCTIHIDAPPVEAGTLRVEGVRVPPGGLRLEVFEGVPLELDLQVAPGIEFVGWKGTDQRGSRVNIDPALVHRVRPLLRALAG